MRRLLALGFVGLMIAGCAPAETENAVRTTLRTVKSTTTTTQTEATKYEPMEKVEYTGFGDDIILFDPPDNPILIAISGNTIEKHFSVRAYSANDSDLLVNTTDSYFGVHPDALNGTNELEIKATGTWTVALYDWTAVSSVSPDEPYEGEDDRVLLMTDIDYSQPITVTIEGNRGERHFAVREYLLLPDEGWSYTDLLVNTTDRYSGSVRSRRGNILYVTGSGKWTVEISQ